MRWWWHGRRMRARVCWLIHLWRWRSRHNPRLKSLRWWRLRGRALGRKHCGRRPVDAMLVAPIVHCHHTTFCRNHLGTAGFSSESSNWFRSWDLWCRNRVRRRPKPSKSICIRGYRCVANFEQMLENVCLTCPCMCHVMS